jgi:hypothetical protein
MESSLSKTVRQDSGADMLASRRDVVQLSVIMTRQVVSRPGLYQPLLCGLLLAPAI